MGRLSAAAVPLLACCLLSSCATAAATRASRTQAAHAPPAEVLTAGISRRLWAQSRAVGSGPSFQPPVRGPVVGACRPRLGSRYGAHVELFAANHVVIVPAGVGVKAPTQMSSGRIAGAGCFGSLVTIDPTGLVLIRPGTRPSLADLFRAWGQPLDATRLASFRTAAGRPVAVFVDGRRWRGAPGAVGLTPHIEIAIELGPYIPPHASYVFPRGT
jgi:hypothetical protein